SRAWYTRLAKPDDCTEDDRDKTCHSGNWAAATAVSGAVITGSRDGKLRAYSTANGDILWEFDTDREFDTVNGVAGYGGGFGGAGPTIVDGMLYVGSGYAILGNAPGNVILAFALPAS
ncbi:MAG: dehydrogenase, partial [Gammaproteobacteria bacterium]|nr:dehydrogenase [Gammaproteobacteria bacterium]